MQPDELQGILKRQIGQFARSVLGHPQRSSLDRSAETHVRVGFRSHERMFPRLQKRRPGDDQ
jgi:hypothetical protein